MLVRIHDRVKVKIDRLKDWVYRDQGMVQVAESARGRKRTACNCQNPCGYRYFPRAERLRDLTWGDVEGFLRRVWPEGLIRAFAKNLDELRVWNRRLKDAGQFAKGDQAVVLLERIPGPVLRAMAHDFPDEFSPTTGLPMSEIQPHIERVLTPFCINREHRPKATADGKVSVQIGVDS